MATEIQGVFILGDRKVEVRQLPKPQPACGQVLIRPVAVGVCGSDVHPYRGQPRSPEHQVVSGHELTGIVEEIGPDVDTVKVGERVVAYQAWSCGRCEACASGHGNLCTQRKDFGQGAFRNRYQKEYSVIRDTMCLPLPEVMTFDDGVMLSCAGGTAWAALQKAKPSCDDAVVVFGLGPVGLMGVFWARAMGAYVIGIDVLPERLALGQKAGAHVVIDASQEDAVARVLALTEGEGASVGFEGAGSQKAQTDILKATRYDARVLYVATGAHGPLIEPTVGRGGRLGLRAVHGCFTFSLSDWYAMVRAIKLHHLQPGMLVTHRFPLERAVEAYAVADSGKCGKVIFAWP
jgi:threonine dehydrogenase-like Zn-dependent dehydrogenase